MSLRSTSTQPRRSASRSANAPRFEEAVGGQLVLGALGRSAHKSEHARLAWLLAARAAGLLYGIVTPFGCGLARSDTVSTRSLVIFESIGKVNCWGMSVSRRKRIMWACK